MWLLGCCNETLEQLGKLLESALEVKQKWRVLGCANARRFIFRGLIDGRECGAYAAGHRLDGRASVPAWDLGFKQRRNVQGRSLFALRRLLCFKSVVLSVLTVLLGCRS